MINAFCHGACTVIALTALVLSGCTTVNTVERAEPIGQQALVPDKRIITDVSLDRKVRIVSVNEAEGAGGLRKVQVEIRNTTRSLRRFNYKFEWFDSRGQLITTPASAFLPRNIEGGENLALIATSPTPQATDFRLKLIED